MQVSKKLLPLALLGQLHGSCGNPTFSYLSGGFIREQDDTVAQQDEQKAILPASSAKSVVIDNSKPDHKLETTIQGTRASVLIIKDTMSEGTIVTIQEGESLANDEDFSQLIQVEGGPKSPAIVVSSSKQKNPLNPFQVHIPLPDESLNLAQLTSKKWIVLCKLIDYSEKGVIKARLLTEKDFTLLDHAITFPIRFFGAFQLLSFSKEIPDNREIVARTSIKSANGTAIISNPLEGSDTPTQAVAVSSTSSSESPTSQVSLKSDDDDESDSDESDSDESDSSDSGPGNLTQTDPSLQDSGSATQLDPVTSTLAPSFRAATDRWQEGGIGLLVSWPSDVTGFSLAEIRREPGIKTFDSCGDGDFVRAFATFTASQLIEFVDLTGSTEGGLFNYQLCVYNQERKVVASGTQTGIRALDTSPPPNIAEFYAQSGSSHGSIKLIMKFSNISEADVSSIVIRRAAGFIPPGTDCSSSGVVVGSFAYSSNSSQEHTDYTSAEHGELFSYRLCMYDASGNLNSNHSVSGVAAQDAVAPPSLQGFYSQTGGDFLGEIVLGLTFPTDTSDYNSVGIRRKVGSNAPSDCQDALLVKSISVFPGGGVFQIDDVGIPGEIYSYRVCIGDGRGNETSQDIATAFTNSRASHRIFVTSYMWKGVEIGGLEGADQKCNFVAEASQKWGIWRAILSGSDHAKDHIQFIAPIRNMLGTNVLTDPSLIWSTDSIPVFSLAAPLNFDELGRPTIAMPWTGSTPDGFAASDTCHDWTGETTSTSESSIIGNPTLTTSKWIHAQERNCYNSGPLYCVDGQINPRAD
ncbi:MAG: hypothetical protein HYW48_10355 [Deltaproteobacteria bacterium]|nr:hypothetical protein [Deltaproteobacteria bacterium]